MAVLATPMRYRAASVQAEAALGTKKSVMTERQSSADSVNTSRKRALHADRKSGLQHKNTSRIMGKARRVSPSGLDTESFDSLL